MIPLLFGIVVLAAVIAVAVAYGAMRNKRAFEQQNELVPGRPSRAPAAWAGAHSPEARLHRRLRTAVQGAAAQARSIDAGGPDLVAAIGRGAEEIDDRLIAAAALPVAHRAAAIAALEPSVAALENAVAGMSSAAIDQGAVMAAVQEAQQRLAALNEARLEVDQLDLTQHTQQQAQPQQQPHPQQQPQPEQQTQPRQRPAREQPKPRQGPDD